VPSKLYSLSKKAAVAFLYGLPPLPQGLHGRLIWIHPRARFSISTRTFFKGEHHVRRWLKERLGPGQVFLDVGAHHGWVSMWALPLVGKEGRVYSFEPSPSNLSILEWHHMRNSFPQWAIVPKAVADRDADQEEFFLIDSGDSPMNSLVTGAPGTPLMSGRKISKTSVPTTSLDTFCSEAHVRPDLVKIDVEGAELLVLQGAVRIIRESCPTIILAVHPQWLPAGQSSRQILEFLTKHGYSICNSAGNPAASLQTGEYLCLCARADSAAAS
jgi:FkbM family methyltransferase